MEQALIGFVRLFVTADDFRDPVWLWLLLPGRWGSQIQSVLTIQLWPMQSQATSKWLGRCAWTGSSWLHFKVFSHFARQRATGIVSTLQELPKKSITGPIVQLPGMAVAVIQRPPVFNGKVAKLDASEALKVKGVKAVLPVPLDRGGQGVAVVASGYWAAKKGREALKVDWDLAGVGKPDTAALTKQYLALAKTPGTPAPKPELQADASGWAKAPKKITADFVFPYLNHAQMEPLACTVDLKDEPKSPSIVFRTATWS